MNTKVPFTDHSFCNPSASLKCSIRKTTENSNQNCDPLVDRDMSGNGGSRRRSIAGESLRKAILPKKSAYKPLGGIYRDIHMVDVVDGLNPVHVKSPEGTSVAMRINLIHSTQKTTETRVHVLHEPMSMGRPFVADLFQFSFSD